MTSSTSRATVWCCESHKGPPLSWLMQNRRLFIFTSRSRHPCFSSQMKEPRLTTTTQDRLHRFFRSAFVGGTSKPKSWLSFIWPQSLPHHDLLTVHQHVCDWKPSETRWNLSMASLALFFSTTELWLCKLYQKSKHHGSLSWSFLFSCFCQRL